MSRQRLGHVLALLPAALAALLVTSGSPGGLVTSVSANPLDKISPLLRHHVSTTAEIEAARADAGAQAATGSNYFPTSDDGCPSNLGDNVKVNQNCVNVSDANLQGRSQAQNETSIAIDPIDPRHVLTSYNDYRRGDSTCGASFSLDGGQTFADTTMPTGFTRGANFGGVAREYWQAGGDTSVAWDSRGNAYMSCQVFMRGRGVTNNNDLSSGFLMFRSTGNNGASWNFPGRFTTFANDVAGSGTILEDKALMAVDNHASSPFRDRIYVTWTEFTATTAYIYEVASKDYGQTFGPRVLVSTASSLCTFPLNPGAGCDNNQFSDPFVGSDGALYVAWANFNTVDFTPKKPGPAAFQVLLAKSTDGGATFGAPVRAAIYYELPDCATYTGLNPFRACVPEKSTTTHNSVFRAASYPSGGVNPLNPSEISISFMSYIGPNSNEANGCVPTGSTPFPTGLYTGVLTPGACKDDILLTVSRDGGATFTGTTTNPRQLTSVAASGKQTTTDQWFQWLAYTDRGRLAVSYYDRQYGDDEATGFSDISLSGSRDLADFGVSRVTSSSMPPPTQFSGQFWGDYTGMDVKGNVAFPLWSDTRGKALFVCPGTGVPGVPPKLCGLTDPNGPANDQDIFTAGVGVPGGG